MELYVIAIMAFTIASGIVIYWFYHENQVRVQQKHVKDQEELERWERAGNDPRMIEHYKYVAQEDFPPSKPFIPPEDRNLQGVPYSREAWRLILPDAAMRELSLAFGENSETAYRVKRSIELSIEHLMEELADDAECARIIEERIGTGAECKTFDFQSYAEKRNRRSEEKREDDHGNV
ncbi:MAG: hypothetical protein JU82_00390 [Sulfuricurvum sp. MLSB]|uniref:hypothetical protein n=1 Tax=unclassified Sulfuricurvum TaxID=2632390 RepID=UPI000505CA6B|nr:MULTISPECIES: hypothetical protein [unclassified Sulfuricurvum]KFN40873.1 MAG: hypothetical protein JU82_00390 [Sulfuricurvum sp. MLSB]